MSMLSFEEFHAEIGNEGAREVLRKGLGLLKRANKATDNFLNEHVPGGKYGNMTTNEVGQAIKQGIEKGTQRVQQTVQKGVQTTKQVGKQAAQKTVQTLIQNREVIEKELEGYSKAADKLENVVRTLPTPIQAAIAPELKLATGAVRIAHQTMRDGNNGNVGKAMETLTNCVHNTIEGVTKADKKLEGLAQGLHDSTDKAKVEKARKKLKEMGMIAAKISGIVGGSGAVGYVGYKGYQKVTGSNEDFYALEDITESNYSEITELLTEVKHIIDTSTSTNDLYSKLQHLEKAKRKELQDVVYGRFTSLPDHKKVELNHLLVEISDGCRAKNITLEQAFSTSPWIWRAFKKTCTLVGATLKMIAGGTVILTTAATGAFAYKNRHLAKAMWKGMKNANSGLHILNTIVKR